MDTAETDVLAALALALTLASRRGGEGEGDGRMRTLSREREDSASASVSPERGRRWVGVGGRGGAAMEDGPPPGRGGPTAWEAAEAEAGPPMVKPIE